MDIWEINGTGHVVSRTEDKEQDSFYIVEKNSDGEWERTGQSISFDEIIIEDVHEVSVETSESAMDLTIFEVKGDANAQILFEFMANPKVSSVEWEHIKIGTEDSQRNIVGNSHDSQSTALVGYHFYTGYTIRESNHYHPSGNEKPSKADINLRQKIQTQQPNSKFYVYVYFGRYVNFSKNETESSERY